MGPIHEVANVSLELGPKAPGLLRAPIPLDVNQHLAIGSEKATPPIRMGGGDQADKELIGLQLVDQMEAPLQCMLGALDKGFWMLVAPFGETNRTPPSQHVDGGAADPTRTSGSAPAGE